MTMVDQPYTVMVKATFIDICDIDEEEASSARARSYSPPRARANSEPLYYKGCSSDDEAVESLSTTNGSDTCETNSTPDRKITSSGSDSSCAWSESDGHAQALVDDDSASLQMLFHEGPQTSMNQLGSCAWPQGHSFDPSLYWMVPIMAADGSVVWAYQPQMFKGEQTNAQDFESKATELEIAAAQCAAAAREAKTAAQQARVQAEGRHSSDKSVEAAKKSKKKKQSTVVRAPESNGITKCDDDRTTLMLRNLPNDYTRDMVLELLDSSGFAGRYDFLYLPVDFHRWAGFGYAFVNMCNNADAECARVYFNGFVGWSVKSQKVCDVCWGEPLQGFDVHVDRYRNSPVMHEVVPDEFRPVIFQDGQRIAFPAPTKRIRAPRTKTRPPSSRKMGRGHSIVCHLEANSAIDVSHLDANSATTGQALDF